MSVIPVDERFGPVNGIKPLNLWGRLAQSLELYLRERTKRTVPEFTLRRSKQEVDRCRRLMPRRSTAPAEARTGRMGGKYSEHMIGEIRDNGQASRRPMAG
jgi:hypothetical protein